MTVYEDEPECECLGETHCPYLARLLWEREAKIQDALAKAEAGLIDGSHHKMWVIDQMVRALLGNEYILWVGLIERDGNYKWDTGVAP